MAKPVCETCQWAGEAAEVTDRGRRLRCELLPRGQYSGLMQELSKENKERFLELMSATVSPGWGCHGWERRSPPDAPPRRTWGV